MDKPFATITTDKPLTEEERIRFMQVIDDYQKEPNPPMYLITSAPLYYTPFDVNGKRMDIAPAWDNHERKLKMKRIIDELNRECKHLLR